jgi:hypothetical protein
MVSGCAQIKMQDKSINPELVSYLNEFQKQAKLHHTSVDSSHLVMRFSEMSDSMLAYCSQSTNGPTVVVKGSWWNDVGNSDRESVVFHELGHCLLHLTHDNSTENAYDYFGSSLYKQGFPSSVMNKYHFSAYTYQLNRETYIDRLFNEKNNTLFFNGPMQIISKVFSH